MKDLVYKALYSSVLGLPISWTLNITFLPILNGMIHENVYLAGVILSLPFLLASFVRIYLIDFVYEKYNVNLSPENLVKKLIQNAKLISSN